MRRSLPVAALAAALAAPAPPAGAQPAPSLEQLVPAALWGDAAAAERASAALASDPSFQALSRERFHDLEELVRQGRGEYPPPPRMAYGNYLPDPFDVTLPDGRQMPVTVQLPPTYDPRTAWPLMLAMHGGPPGSVDQASRSAERMLRVWREAAFDAGWIVVSPAMTTVVSVGQRTEDRLPYEILHPEQMEAILAAVGARYRIDPGRIVSTGISLGSNFSIAFGAGRPDRFAAIVPVSTEGDSREHLLRNLRHVPVYILEGTQDRNIRTITGPNALRDIVAGFGYDLTYREFGDRAHEGFQEHYPDVLRWLSDRPREVYPREVLRVPHRAIVPVARRVHWVEADTRQALLRARVTGPSQIDVEARHVRELRLLLHDRLVDLDQPVTVRVNGVTVHEGKVARSAALAVEEIRRSGDEGRIFAAELRVAVPQTPASIAVGRALADELAPRHPEGTLSFWEMYAVRSLEERFPKLGLEGELVTGAAARDLGLEGEQAAVRLSAVDPAGPFAKSGLRPGDLLLEVGGEPFFEGRGLEALLHWLQRELRGEPQTYAIAVSRDGKRLELRSELALGPYRE